MTEVLEWKDIKKAMEDIEDACNKEKLKALLICGIFESESGEMQIGGGRWAVSVHTALTLGGLISMHLTKMSTDIESVVTRLRPPQNASHGKPR